jgi:hypothetical protein
MSRESEVVTRRAFRAVMRRVHDLVPKHGHCFYCQTPLPAKAWVKGKRQDTAWPAGERMETIAFPGLGVVQIRITTPACLPCMQSLQETNRKQAGGRLIVAGAGAIPPKLND